MEGRTKNGLKIFLSDVRVQICLIAFAYFLTARLSLLLAFQETNVSPVWPPSGLAFAAMLVFGRRIWPGILIGAFLANSLNFLNHSMTPLFQVYILSFLIAIGNTLEAVLGVNLFRKLIFGSHPLLHTKDVFIFFAITLVMCLVGAYNGLIWLSLAGQVPLDLFSRVFVTWWSGDVTGILTVIPILWMFSQSLRSNFKKRTDVSEFLLFLICAVLSNFIVFGGKTSVSLDHWPLAYIVFPVMVWGSCRFLRLGLGIMTLITSVYAVWGTLQGFGSFGHLPKNEALILVQMLVSMVSLTGMALTAAMQERNHFLRELEGNKVRFEQIFEFSPIAKMIINASGKIEMFNRQAERLFGYSREEALTMDYDLLLPDRIHSRKNIKRADVLSSSSNRPVRLEKDIYGVGKKGEPIPIELDLTNLDISGKKHILALITDITVRKHSELILKEREAYFRTMADHAPVMIWMAGADTKFHFFNKPWLTFTGRSIEQESGNGWVESVYPDDVNRCLEQYTSAFNRRVDFTMDYRVRRADNEYRWILNSGVPLHNYNGTFIGYIGSCVDITDLKKAEEILQRDKEALTDLVDEGLKELTKTEQKLKHSSRLAGIGTLAATVAHELRNPLGVIQMASYNLKMKHKELADSRHLQNIEKKIFESNQIINNLLNYSSIKPPQHTLVNICEILDECMQTVSARFLGNKIFLQKRYPPNQVCHMEVDTFQIREVFNNVMVNAVQSMKENEGSLVIQVIPTGDFIKISITDSGCGIDPEDLTKIFQPFFTRKSKGTGLGLAICNELIELHNGRIDVDSKVGFGTTVTITLPKRKS